MKWEDEYQVLKKVYARLENEAISANNFSEKNYQNDFARGIFYARGEVFTMMCEVINKNLYLSKEEKTNED